MTQAEDKLKLGLVMGLCIGFLQWLIIKQYTIKANWWLLASAMQWATYFLCLTNYIIIPNLKMNINLGLFDVFQILLVSLIMSASITGTALVWLFPADRWRN